MFRPAKYRILALLLSAAPTPGNAQGVPIVDLQQIGQWLLQRQQSFLMQSAERQESERRDGIIHQQSDQLAALDETLTLLTASSRFPPDMEGQLGGNAGGQPNAQEVYAIDDNNQYAARLFGDAPETIEKMIADTAVEYSSSPALARAGINAVEFRCWFQGLVKQESQFSIGARSPKAAFGLTQIVPGTAQDLGIYPDYYDDPRLQLEGGARYLLQQLQRFGSMELALAAYNAGPGAVQQYNGIPPYPETQNYVVKIRANYQLYASRITGADDLGTLDPRDMAIAESSNIADAGMHYATASMDTMHAAATRLRNLVARIPQTGSVKEAMDLNTYARAEVARMASILNRLQVTSRKVEAARYALLLQAYADDEKYLQVRMDQ